MRPLALAAVLAPPLCWSCRSATGGAEHLCGPCRAGLLWLGPAQPGLEGMAVWAAVAYEGAAQELVRALKYRGARGVAATMAAQMAANAPRLEGTLVPVPLHRTRRRRRGFNQAGALVDQLAARTGLPALDCLEHTGRGAPQVGRRRSERLVAPAVRVREGLRGPARALLVDDVVTTGSTLAACARALRAAGSAEVAAIAYARTLGR